ncbi:hypothetical protein RND71_025108 [Anisodus tanguticus]|uniref:GDNF/GAS1 domain-containing protein n=1 Tax=Anisodus tanguticus TaxID=243964 RepID=A0AAE1V5H7_9SOLA|nr:hypothetical protein RND71_025108 [Anisodus tanguticus]
MIVNVAPSSSINSPATFPVNRSSNIPGLPNPFVLQTKGSIFSCRKITSTTTGRRIVVAATDMKEGDVAEKKTCPVGIMSIVGEASVSPLKSAPWLDVMLHTKLFQYERCPGARCSIPPNTTLTTLSLLYLREYTLLMILYYVSFYKCKAERLKWADEEFEMIVFSDNFVKSKDEINHVRNELDRADILVVVAVRKEVLVNWIQSNSLNVPNIICFDSSLALRNKLGGSLVETEKRGDVFSSLLPFSQSKKLDESVEIARTVSESWERHNSDDIRFCLLVIINAYITAVSTLKNLRAKGFSTLNCMVTNCGPQILNCLLDPNCRKALQCLNNCSPVDQVCNYRCIASYESKYLEEFSLCVLQKNNCLELDAKIPEKPCVPPMSEFRGEKLFSEIAEDLFVGCTNYSIGEKPEDRSGMNQFSSVLDNGVVSNEFWTIVDVSDDLSWGLFHYHGAARVARQSYTGAVLVSPDGQYPAEKGKERLVSALDRCGIKEWELFNVDNCSCENALLGLPEGSSLHTQIQVHGQTHSSV